MFCGSDGRREAWPVGERSAEGEAPGHRPLARSRAGAEPRTQGHRPSGLFRGTIEAGGVGGDDINEGAGQLMGLVKAEPKTAGGRMDAGATSAP